MAKVRAHTRTVRGRRQKVRPHSRQLQPRRAAKNAKRAYRAAKHKRHSVAFWAGSAAVAEIAAWTAARGAGLLLTTIGIVAVAAGVALTRTTR